MNFLPVLAAAFALTPPAVGAEGPPRVALETALGTIVVELEPARAPITTANFLRYVDEGLFGGATFYRVVRDDNQPDNPVRIDVIQGGLGFHDEPRPLPPIAHETSEITGVRHLDGTLSMARSEPGTASSEVFICVGDQPELDFGGRRNPDGQGFAAFGRVIEGMDVVRAIHRSPAEGQFLRRPVEIHTVRRFE
jgi:peptidyl-prolyl cis-trans isomerase A (cyclophilin A)